MRVLIAVLWGLPGLIHLLPLAGVLGAESLARLYALPFEDPSLQILMRHRAVLFGLLGALLVAAAFRPALRPLAFMAGLASVLSFLVLAGAVGGYNAALARVVAADWIALACLLPAGLLHWRATRHPPA